jgi:putative redox protein
MTAFSPKTATATNAGSAFTTQIEVQGHHLTADEPIEDGGQNEGPSPTRLLRSALASCQAMTMRSYANRKRWNLRSITVRVDLQSQAVDGTTRYNIVSAIELDGDLDSDQRSRLRDIAAKCPVHRILASGATITTEVV